MARRCDRCRVEYESGADFGGYDYCMTCYTRVKQEEEQKRAAAARIEQQKMDFLRKRRNEEYVYLKIQEEKKERAAMVESRKLATIDSKKKRDYTHDKMRERRKWEPAYLERRRAEANESPGVSMLGTARKKPAAQAPQISSEPNYFPSGMPVHIPDEMKKKHKQGVKPIEQSGLSLSVAEGLPVSLSLGQKQVQVLLVGKSASLLPIAAGLEVSLLDSQNSAIPWKATPRTCTLEPSGESKIKVEFDVPEGAARGRLSFTALLKENAIYIDRQAAHSETVSLSSQVKTPMDLQYKSGSASIKSESLALVFNNVGESGGILETASFVVYFSGESIGKKASLLARTKVKGGEKGILLSFAPVDASKISSLEINLVGKDSNGKPYSLKKKIKLDGGENNTSEKPGGKNTAGQEAKK